MKNKMKDKDARISELEAKLKIAKYALELFLVHQSPLCVNDHAQIMIVISEALSVIRKGE